MPFRSNFNLEIFGLDIFPANITLLQFLDLINFNISPNLPTLIKKLFLSFLNLLFFVRSIIKYLIFFFFYFT